MSATLVGRLQQRVAKDPRLAWLQGDDVAAPLDHGLTPTHHRRWSVVGVTPPPPGDPQGWYVEFTSRWRAYLEALVVAPGSRPMSQVLPELLSRICPAPRGPLAASPPMNTTRVTSSSTLASQGAAPTPPAATSRTQVRRRQPPDSVEEHGEPSHSAKRRRLAARPSPEHLPPAALQTACQWRLGLVHVKRPHEPPCRICSYRQQPSDGWQLSVAGSGNSLHPRGGVLDGGTWLWTGSARTTDLTEEEVGTWPQLVLTDQAYRYPAAE